MKSCSDCFRKKFLEIKMSMKKGYKLIQFMNIYGVYAVCCSGELRNEDIILELKVLMVY